MEALRLATAIKSLIAEEINLDVEALRAQEAEMLRVEREGYRVGYTDGPLRGEGPWEITDVRTGQIVERGEGVDELEAAWTAGRWWMIDEDLGCEHVHRSNPGLLPNALWETLREWIWENPAEAKEILGTDLT
jgi:hypothetical protein